MTTTTLKQQLLQFLSQNDNDMLNEEAYETLWVSISRDCDVPHDITIDVENSRRIVVARFSLDLTELPL